MSGAFLRVRVVRSNGRRAPFVASKPASNRAPHLYNPPLSLMDAHAGDAPADPRQHTTCKDPLMPTTRPRGRQFFANPGPTNIPDSVLRAMDRPSIDFNDPDFVEVYDEAFAGVKRVLRTSHHLFMYNASGHGACEASLTN